MLQLAKVERRIMPARLIEYKDRDQLPDEQAVVLFDHITRSGGTTLNKIFMKYYETRYINVNNYDAINFTHAPESKQLYTGHGISDIHYLLGDDVTAFYFTLIRHPFEWCLSKFRSRSQWRRHANQNSDRNSLDQYIYRNPLINPLVYWLGHGDLHLAEEVLFERYAFFGITEYFAQSLGGLAKLLPWLSWQTVTNVNMSPKGQKDSIIPSKLVEEYFLEKNAKDMELYAKAVEEFKNRMYAETKQYGECDNIVSVVTTDKSYIIQKDRDGYVSRAFDRLRNTDVTLNSFELLFVYINLGNDITRWKTFYDYTREKEQPLCKWYAFLCCAKLGDHETMNPLGIEIFDIIDRLDSQNNVSHLVKIRLDMIQAILTNWSAFSPGPFTERCLEWAKTLRSARGWTGTAWSVEAKLWKAYGEHAIALDCARKAFAIETDRDDYQAYLADLLLATEKVDETETLARKALENNPECEWAVRQLALALHAKGDLPGAEKAFRHALTINPYWLEGRMAFSRLYQEYGMMNQAIEQAGEGARLFPNNAACIFHHCDLLVVEGRLDAAESAVQTSLVVYPHWGHLHKILSLIHEARGNVDVAIDEARIAVEKVPKSTEYRRHLVNLLLRHDRVNEAEAAIRDSFISGFNWGYLHKVLSLIYDAQGNIGTAIDEAKIAVEKDPESIDYREHLINLQIQYDNLDNVEKEVRKNVIEFPNQAWPCLQLAKICEARGDLQAALKQARKALSLQPNKLSLKASYAHMLRRCREYTACHDFCQKELDKDPGQGWAWRELCRLAEQQGDRNAALEYGAKAISVHPDDHEFKHYYDALKGWFYVATRESGKAHNAGKVN